MAIDGTKIIDGDYANDIYNEFMDLYDEGESVDKIKEKIEKNAFKDDLVEYEIFITTYAFALWEIGFLTEDIIADVIKTSNKGEGVKMWREESGEKDALSRQKELDKLIKKISKPKLNIRKRKKYKKVEKFLLSKGDVVLLKNNKGVYYVSIMVNILQHKGKCYYYFVPTTYRSKDIPNRDLLLQESIICTSVGTSVDVEKKFILKETNVKHLGKMRTIPQCSFLVIEHKKLREFIQELTIIDNYKINDHFNEGGSYRGVDSFSDYIERFDNQEEEVRIFKQIKFSLKKSILNSNKNLIKKLLGL